MFEFPVRTLPIREFRSPRPNLGGMAVSAWKLVNVETLATIPEDGTPRAADPADVDTVLGIITGESLLAIEELVKGTAVTAAIADVVIKQSFIETTKEPSLHWTFDFDVLLLKPLVTDGILLAVDVLLAIFDKLGRAVPAPAAKTEVDNDVTESCCRRTVTLLAQIALVGVEPNILEVEGRTLVGLGIQYQPCAQSTQGQPYPQGQLRAEVWTGGQNHPSGHSKHE